MGSTIVTLTTDWGYSDFFAGSVKGKLYSTIPGVQVVDITHGIPPYQLNRATFVVKHGCLGFPPGTIHIIDVCSSQSKDHPFVVVEHNGQYFICTDNGLPAAIFGYEGVNAVIIDGVSQDSDYYTFAARDLFCKVAAMLAQGAPLSSLGFPTDTLLRKTSFSTTCHDNDIKVHVIYIDSYGNCNLNITLDEFEQFRQGRKFEMQVHEVRLNKISHTYIETDSKNPFRSSLLLTVSSTGHLQLALTNGNASQMFNLQYHETVVVKFF